MSRQLRFATYSAGGRARWGEHPEGKFEPLLYAAAARHYSLNVVLVAPDRWIIDHIDDALADIDTSRPDDAKHAATLRAAVQGGAIAIVDTATGSVVSATADEIDRAIRLTNLEIN